MCIEPTAEFFEVVHHELGHNYYQMAYMNQPPLYQGGANDGFHEAIGDTIAKSVTPDYLKQLGLIDTVPDESKDIGLLLDRALDKVAFLPFGYMVDQWRWKVFSGEIKPEEYNKGWWDLRLKYQGLVPPVPRSEKDFDAGAKYHVASNTPYAAVRPPASSTTVTAPASVGPSRSKLIRRNAYTAIFVITPLIKADTWLGAAGWAKGSHT